MKLANVSSSKCLPDFTVKMKDIENDVVPFGFIDDGSAAIAAIEHQEDPWKIREADTERFVWDPDDMPL